MAYIYVNKSKFHTLEASVKQIEKKVENIEDDFKNVTNRLDWDITSASGILAAISKIESEMEDQCASLGKIASFLSFAKNQYNSLDTVNEGAFKKFWIASEFTIRTNPIVNSIVGWFSDKIREKIHKFIGNQKKNTIKVAIDLIPRLLGYKSITPYKLVRAIKASIRKVKCIKEPYQVETMVKMAAAKANNIGLTSIISRMKNAMSTAKTTIMKSAGKVAIVGAILEAAEGAYYGFKNKEPFNKIMAGAGFDLIAGGSKAVASIAVTAVASAAVVAVLPLAIPGTLVTAAALVTGAVAGGFASGMIGKIVGTPDGKGYKLLKDKEQNSVTIREWFVNTIPNYVEDTSYNIKTAITGGMRVTIPNPDYGCVPCY